MQSIIKTLQKAEKKMIKNNLSLGPQILTEIQIILKIVQKRVKFYIL